MTIFGDTKSAMLEKTNEEIQARLVRQFKRRARRAETRETPVEPKPQDRRGANPTTPTSIHSFAELSRVARNVPLPTRPPEFASSSPTIEMLIAELVRPPLSKWLRENLPLMVERIVQDEVHAQSRDWLDNELPPIVERLARQTLRDMLSRAARQSAA